MTEIAETIGDGLSRDAGELQEEKPPHDSRSRVVIFLPALNEEGGIGHVMDRIPRAELEAAGHSVSVWIVDGNSTDRTLEVGRARGAKVFVQDGRGKGNGMRQAFHQRLHRRDYTDGGSFDREFYMMLDADGTYPPEAIPEFVESLASGNDVATTPSTLPGATRSTLGPRTLKRSSVRGPDSAPTPRTCGSAAVTA